MRQTGCLPAAFVVVAVLAVGGFGLLAAPVLLIAGAAMLPGLRRPESRQV
jgi:hypothetical protein